MRCHNKSSVWIVNCVMPGGPEFRSDFPCDRRRRISDGLCSSQEFVRSPRLIHRYRAYRQSRSRFETGPGVRKLQAETFQPEVKFGNWDSVIRLFDTLRWE